MNKKGEPMKRIVLWAGLTLLALHGSWAIAWPVPIPGGELGEKELNAIEGEALYLGVDRESGTMNVTSIVPGDYSRIECYTVGATTKVVRNIDAPLPKNALVNTNREIVASNGVKYNPTQLAPGTYTLSTTSSNVAGQGPGIKIDVTQVVTNSRGQTAISNDFYIHGIQYTNTNGCVGVMNNSMARVMTTYLNAVGPKVVQVSGRR
jgi:hypothetical protein